MSRAFSTFPILPINLSASPRRNPSFLLNTFPSASSRMTVGKPSTSYFFCNCLVGLFQFLRLFFGPGKIHLHQHQVLVGIASNSGEVKHLLVQRHAGRTPIRPGKIHQHHFLVPPSPGRWPWADPSAIPLRCACAASQHSRNASTINFFMTCSLVSTCQCSHPLTVTDAFPFTPDHLPAHDRHHRPALQRPAVERAVIRLARGIAAARTPIRRSGSNTVTSASAPAFNVPFSNRNNRAGATVNFAINSGKPSRCV